MQVFPSITRFFFRILAGRSVDDRLIGNWNGKIPENYFLCTIHSHKMAGAAPSVFIPRMHIHPNQYRTEVERSRETRKKSRQIFSI